MPKSLRKSIKNLIAFSIDSGSQNGAKMVPGGVLDLTSAGPPLTTPLIDKSISKPFVYYCRSQSVLSTSSALRALFP